MNVREMLETVRRVEIRTNRLVNDMMVGGCLSQFKGRGLDFEELREYMPGDDVRDIDWNVTNRMGRPFIKEYREERELGIVVAMDISASSSFASGSLTKREFAAEVGATLAFSATRNGDKAALCLFTDQVELFLPMRKSRRHILRMIQEMLFHEPRNKGTRIGSALAFLNHMLHRTCLVFLITDFLHSFDPNKTSTSSRSALQEIGLANARHDLVCIHLHDPLESQIPEVGLLTIEDAETGELLELDSHRASLRERYAQSNADRLNTLDRALRQTGIPSIRLNTREPFAQKLQTFFETRQRGQAWR